MNIHGYKKSAKEMALMLRKELSKYKGGQNHRKIHSLQIAIRDCHRRIKELKEIRDKK